MGQCIGDVGFDFHETSFMESLTHKKNEDMGGDILSDLFIWLKSLHSPQFLNPEMDTQTIDDVVSLKCEGCEKDDVVSL